MAFGLFQRDQSSTVIFQPLTPILSPSRGDINPNACSLNGGEPESPPRFFTAILPEVTRQALLSSFVLKQFQRVILQKNSQIAATLSNCCISVCPWMILTAPSCSSVCIPSCMA